MSSDVHSLSHPRLEYQSPPISLRQQQQQQQQMPPPVQPSLPPIPTSFLALKSRILTSLSVPPESYTDASPKGTLDTAIVPLIERLNLLDGVVSTSSCAGRISVFLEGRKKKKEGVKVSGIKKGDGDHIEEKVGDDDDDDDDDKEVGYDEEGAGGRVGTKMSVPGGKGLGGRWLFVSHEPIEMSEHAEGRGRDRYDEGGALTKLFGLTTYRASNRIEHGACSSSVSEMKNARIGRFAFEPM
ncbi:MAG: hypothetical protein L6R36_008819, partial [Xanthoria steineri]